MYAAPVEEAAPATPSLSADAPTMMVPPEIETWEPKFDEHLGHPEFLPFQEE
jgi:hypothetical protein